MFNRVDFSEPMTLNTFINLYNLRARDKETGEYRDKFCCPRVVPNPHVSPLTDPITGEILYDENTGEVLYPTVIDHQNWDIMLWDNFTAGGSSLAEILTTYGDKQVLETIYKETDIGTKVFIITVQ